jgi:extracellular matrix protein 14
MHRDILPFLSFIVLLFACVPIAAYSVPYKSPAGTDRQSSPTHRYHADPKYNFRSVFPQLTWIRDASALKVAGVFDAFYSLSSRLGLSQKTVKTGHAKQTLSRPSNAQLPANLLAKYGGDIVLRFNLSTSLEEKALAEAADTLFLDVWAFTSNWADIRLREDDV